MIMQFFFVHVIGHIVEKDNVRETEKGVVDVIGHIVEKDSVRETEKGKFVLQAKVISESNIGRKRFHT